MPLLPEEAVADHLGASREFSLAWQDVYRNTTPQYNGLDRCSFVAPDREEACVYIHKHLGAFFCALSS